jgi:hypothetical protein
VYALRCRGILVGETFCEKDFDDRIAGRDPAGRACFARRASHARYRLESCELAPCASPPQAQQEFAPRQATPGRKATQSNAVKAAQNAVRELLARHRNQFCANAKRGSQAAPRFAIFALSSAEQAHYCASFAADAHRMRGVISLCLALSPVESYRLFPWQVSSRLPCTPM